MPYDPQRSRAAVRAIIKEYKISAAAWSRKAGFSKNQIGEFLRGTSDSLKVSTAVRLADAVGVNPLELMGLPLSLELNLPEATMAVALAELDASMIRSAESDAQAQNARQLLVALARSMGVPRASPVRPSLPAPAKPGPRK